MNYNIHYTRLIERARCRTINGYTEYHHIIPRCIGGTNDPINLVDLTPEEHLVAHLLLVKIYNNPSLIYAAKWMINRVKNNKEYGWLRRKHTEIMSNRIVSDETRQKMSAAQQNRPKEVQDKITYAQQNRSVEVRKNMSEAQMGHRVTEDTKEKLRQANLGKNHTEETCKKISRSHIGENNHFYGKTHSDESKQKMKDARLKQIISEESKIKRSIKMKEYWANRKSSA
jgi:hypothetical protein